MPEPRKQHEVVDDGYEAAKEWRAATTPEAKAVAQRKLDALYAEAKAIEGADPAAGIGAREGLEQARRQAGMPPAAPIDPPAPAEPTKAAQTRSGAAGPATASQGHGFIRPEVSGDVIGQLSKELLDIQKALCRHLGTKPAGLDERRGGQSSPEDTAWEGAYSELIAQLAIKEQQLAWNAAVAAGGFDESNAAALAKIRDHFTSAADELAKSDVYRAKAEAMRAQVLAYDQTYDSLKENLVGGSASGDVKKGAAKSKKGVDQAVQGGNKAARWASGTTDADKRLGEAKKLADVKKVDQIAPTPTKAMGHVGKLNPMGQAAGLMGAGFLRMGQFASMLRELELDKAGSAVGQLALAHQRAAEEALGALLDEKIGIGIEALNKRLARENEGSPTFTLHRHGSKKWDKRIAEGIGSYYERELLTSDGRYLPSEHLGVGQIRRGVPFDPEELKKWCRSKGLLALAPAPSRRPLYIAVAAALLVVLVVAFVAFGNRAPSNGPGVLAGDAPAAGGALAGGDAPAADVGPPMYVIPILGCGDVTHLALDSLILYTVLLATEQGLVPDGTTVDLAADGANGTVRFETTGGVGQGTFPISVFDDFPIAVNSVVGPDGPLELIGDPVFDVVSVDAAQGPVGGCVAATTLSEAERAALAQEASGRFPTTAVVVDDPGAIPPPEDVLAPFRAFVSSFDLAHREQDVDTLLDALAPATIARYGNGQCRAYLEATAGTITNLFLVDGRPDPWDYPTDGRTTDIPGAWAIDMEADVAPDGARTSFEFHLVETNDGVRYFTDCGDPI